MPEVALATRTSTARAAAIAVIAAAVAPGAAAFGAGSALQLHSMSVALPRGALSARRPCMAAAGGNPAHKQGAEPRLLGSRRLHRWVKGGDKAAAARHIKDDILTSAANSQEIFQASMLLGASLTRTRIHEVAMGMARETLTKDTFKSFDADNSSTISLDELKMAARFDEQRRPVSEVLLKRWLRQNWLRSDPSTARIQDVATRLDLNGDGEVDFGEFEQFMQKEVYSDASFSGALQLRR